MTEQEKEYYNGIISMCNTLMDKSSLTRYDTLDSFYDEDLISELLRIKYVAERADAEPLIKEAAEHAVTVLNMLDYEMFIPDYYIDSDLLESTSSKSYFVFVIQCIIAGLAVYGCFSLYGVVTDFVEKLLK